MHSTEHGLIYGWTGNPLYLPNGFVVCDGDNGTPDMRDRFVVGALDTYGVGEKNGVSVHVHNFTTDSHVHSRPAGSDMETGGGPDEWLDSKTDAGTTNPAEFMPRFYALCFLMKL